MLQIKACTKNFFALWLLFFVVLSTAFEDYSHHAEHYSDHAEDYTDHAADYHADTDSHSIDHYDEVRRTEYSVSADTRNHDDKHHEEHYSDHAEDYTDHAADYHADTDSHPIDHYDEVRRTEYSVSADTSNHDDKHHEDHDSGTNVHHSPDYSWNSDRRNNHEHTAAAARPIVTVSSDCEDGLCVRREECFQDDFITSPPTGDCKWRIGGDWVCCRKRVKIIPPVRPYYTTGRPRGTKTTTTAATPYTAITGARWHTHQSETSTTRPNDECHVGTCVQKKECEDQDIVKSRMDVCRERLSGYWVCCRRKTAVTFNENGARRPSTRTEAWNNYSTKRPKTTTSNNYSTQRPRSTTRNNYSTQRPRSTTRNNYSTQRPRSTTRNNYSTQRPRSTTRNNYSTQRPRSTTWNNYSTQRPRSTTWNSYSTQRSRTTTWNNYSTQRPRSSTSNNYSTKRPRTTTAVPNRQVTTENVWRSSTLPHVASISKQDEECVTGQCVLLEDCGKENIVVTLRDTCGKRRTGQWICCLKKRQSSNPRFTTTTTKPTVRNWVWGNKSTPRKVTTTEAPRRPIYSGCGLREGFQERHRRSTSDHMHPDTEMIPGHTSLWNSLVRSAKVVGGKEAEPYSWPWMAALFRETSPEMKRFVFAGTLISDRYILTAAHVFTPQDIRNASSYLVMLGTHTGSESVMEYVVQSILLHPKYQHRFYYNDIALLKLERRVTFNSFVYPVCLPPGNTYCDDSELVGRRVTVTGWGDQAFGGKSSDVLKEATFPVVSRESCNSSYVRVASTTFPRGITEKMLCAGAPNGGKDACQGDSGGPLTLKEGQHWVQVGIVSFGYRCGDSQYPGVYTKVGYYVDWINEIVQR